MANRSPRHTRAGQWNLRGKKSLHCDCRCCSVFNLRDIAEKERVINEEIRPAVIGDIYPDIAGNGFRETLPDVRESDGQDRGQWEPFFGRGGSVRISSSDFEHDVVLYVNGDFIDEETKMEYAKLIAARLNQTIPE